MSNPFREGENHAMFQEKLLLRREARALRQRRWVRRHRLPLVSFTLNIPGPVKQSPLYARVHAEGLGLLLRCLPVAAYRKWDFSTGSEALLAVGMDARDLKRFAMRVEEGHPLGRLFDLDVLDEAGGKLSRRDLGAAPRRCLVCPRPAAECARSQRHPLPELLRAVEALAHAFFFSAAALRRCEPPGRNLLAGGVASPSDAGLPPGVAPTGFQLVE